MDRAQHARQQKNQWAVGTQCVIIKFPSEETGARCHQGQAQTPSKADPQLRAAEKNKAIPQIHNVSLVSAPGLALSKLRGLLAVAGTSPAWVPGLLLFLMPPSWQRNMGKSGSPTGLVMLILMCK